MGRPRSRAAAAEETLRLPGAPVVVAAFDKFRHTATATALCDVVGDVAWELGWSCAPVPMADGGEGTLDVLAGRGGVLRTTTVSGPTGEPVAAAWLLRGSTAFVEMARASGLALVGGAEGNDPLGASTFGTGELISAAVAAGARRVVVLLGGSATTDGGFGALRALEPLPRLRGVALVVACDVETTFVDAAEVFAPQKGATAAQVALLRRRLERLADVYLAERGVDVRSLAGSGAAGGLAGGLASIGATIESGFALVADEAGLAERVAGASLVITGEGFVDAESFHGKVVGGVCELAAEAGVPVLVVAGGVEHGLAVPGSLAGTIRGLVSLADRFGPERSWADPLGCVRAVVAEVLAEGSPAGGPARGGAGA